MAGDRDAEIENACEIIALCLELSCGRQEGERWKEGAASDT